MGFVRRLRIAAVSTGICVLAALPVTAEVLTLGSVSDNVKKELIRFEPFANYLAAALADDGITEVRISVLTSSDEMIVAMQNGDVDLFFDSPLVATNVADRAGGQPMLRRWKDGIATYHSLVIVPVDSDIETIEDLAGHRIGFQEPDSTSGFLLPAAMMRAAGITLQELRSRDAAPVGDQLGYMFTLDDRNTVTWLHRGWVDAAATDPSAFAELDAALPGQYRVIARSVDVPRQIVVRSGDMSPEMTERLTDVMTGMHLTEEGRAVLTLFNETSQFDRFPDGVEVTFAPIRAILAELRALALY